MSRVLQGLKGVEKGFGFISRGCLGQKSEIFREYVWLLGLQKPSHMLRNICSSLFMKNQLLLKNGKTSQNQQFWGFLIFDGWGTGSTT
jgi:hypothetical protein